MRRGRGAHARDRLLSLRQWLTPQRVNIGMLSRDCDRGVRGTTEIDRDMRLLQRLYFSGRACEFIVLAFMIDWFVRGPDAAKDFDVLVGACIALVVRQEIAVLALLAVVAAGDDV